MTTSKFLVMKTKTVLIYFLMILFTLSIKAQDAKQVISDMIETVGGKANFYKLKNVTYDYEYINPKAPMTLKSHETYVFHKEKSHAAYSTNTVTAPDGQKVVEGYDGTNAWVTMDGKLSNDEQANNFARFMRKTNYYWFSMFFKLLDDGVNHEYLGSKTVNGKAYDKVKITFGNNVGDAQDIYVLFINKETKLVDQFLFTVMSFQMAEPQLMVMEYVTIDGIQIGSKRKYIEADWEGNIKGKQWVTTNWSNIDFDTDVDISLFERP